MTRSQRRARIRQCKDDRESLSNAVALSEGGVYTNKGGAVIARAQFRVPPMASTRCASNRGFNPTRCSGRKVRA